MFTPILSILIPVFNAAPYLKRCLDSIINQPEEYHTNLEVIIINDGSLDESLDIIQDYSSKFEYIHVISRENKGIGATRNELIDNAKGRYFWFIDADDYISELSFSIIFPLLQINRYDMLLLSYFWGNGNKGRNILYSGEYTTGFEMAENDIYNNSLWTRIYRTSIIRDNQIRFHQLTMGEDFDFIFHIIPFLGKIKCIEKPLYNYIANSNSAVFKSDLKHRIQVSEDSLNCISYNTNWLKSFDKKKQLILRRPLNAFLMGYIFSLYVVPFNYHYKIETFNKLLEFGAIPIKPVPSSFMHKIRTFIVNNNLLRKISLWCDVVLLKLIN